jgi:hypothetical protein
MHLPLLTLTALITTSLAAPAPLDLPREYTYVNIPSFLSLPLPSNPLKTHSQPRNHLLSPLLRRQHLYQQRLLRHLPRPPRARFEKCPVHQVSSCYRFLHTLWREGVWDG